MINDTAGSATAIALGTPHPAVIELFVGGSFCTGTLIDATHVLTAQHCTFGASTGSMSVHFHHLNNDGASGEAARLYRKRPSILIATTWFGRKLTPATMTCRSFRRNGSAWSAGATDA